MLLKAAINGGRASDGLSRVPVTLKEIVEASVSAVRAGADVVHAHLRTTGSEQTISPHAVGEWVRAMRAADPRIVIGTTTGLWTVSSHAERMDHIRAWPADALPDFASVAYSETGADDVAALVVERGMALESAVWSPEDVPALLHSRYLQRNIRILIEPEVEDPGEAVSQCRNIAADLRAAGVTAPILYHGFDETVWPVVRAAIEDGCETRIGFEDGVALPDGSIAVTNDELITAVRTLERQLVAVAGR